MVHSVALMLFMKLFDKIKLDYKYQLETLQSITALLKKKIPVYFSSDTETDITEDKVYFLVHSQVNGTCLSLLKYPIPSAGVIQTYLTLYDMLHDQTIPELTGLALRPGGKTSVSGICDISRYYSSPSISAFASQTRTAAAGLPDFAAN